MNRNPDLVKVIGAQPKDPAPRRVYADWLLERSDPRGEYVQAALTLATQIDPARRKKLFMRAAQLLSQHQETWSADVKKLGAQGLRFSNGFIAEMTLAESQLKNFEQLLELEPITHLVVKLESGAALALAMKSPSFARIRHLTVEGAVDKWASAIEKSELPPAGLEAMLLRGASASALEVIATRRALSGLQRLSVTGNQVGNAGLEALANGVLRLSTLYAARAGLDDEGVAAFVMSDAVTPLEHLALGGNDLGDESLEAIISSQTLKKLRKLELCGGDFSAETLAELAKPSTIPSLRILDLKHVYVGPNLVAPLMNRFRDGLKF